MYDISFQTERTANGLVSSTYGRELKRFFKQEGDRICVTSTQALDFKGIISCLFTQQRQVIEAERGRYLKYETAGLTLSFFSLGMTRDVSEQQNNTPLR
jgi:hypothetical protein